MTPPLTPTITLAPVDSRTAPASTAPEPRVIDLDAPQRARRAGESREVVSGWSCPECDLVAGPFRADEAAMLAAVHDRVMGHPIRTAIRLTDVRLGTQLLAS